MPRTKGQKRKNPAISGLDRFLARSLREDREFKALFEQAIDELPAASARRAVRGLGMNQK